MIGEQLKRFARSSAIYGTGSVLNRFLHFLLVPVFTWYLHSEDYGVMAMLGILTMMLTGLFSLGTGSSMGICYFAEENRTERPRIVWTTAGLLLLNSAVWLAVGILAAPVLSQALFHSSEHADLVSLALAVLAVNTVVTPFSSYLRLEEKARLFISVSIVSTLVSLGLHIFAVVFMGRGIRGMFEAALGGSLVLLVATVVAISPSLRFGVNRHWVPQLVRIGFPSIFGLGAFFLIDWADRVMLQRMVGLGELGVYSVGYAFGMVMVIATEGAFGGAWPPFFMSFINRRQEAIEVFGKIFKYCLFFCGTLTLFFFLFARPVVTLMTAPEFHAAYTVVGMVAGAYMLKACYLVMLPGLYFEQKLYLQAMIEWGAALLNVGLNLLLIPLMQKEGAAVATLLSYLTLPILAYGLSHKYLPVRYDYNAVGRFTVLLASCAGISYILAGFSIGWHTAGATALIVCFSLAIFRFVLTSQERTLALGFLRKVLSTLPFQTQGPA